MYGLPRIPTHHALTCMAPPRPDYRGSLTYTQLSYAQQEQEARLGEQERARSKRSSADAITSESGLHGR